jgi:vitamin B12/bleomycin/antimicrobial peptide transport system ATP-binding/permease protein
MPSAPSAHEAPSRRWAFALFFRLARAFLAVRGADGRRARLLLAALLALCLITGLVHVLISYAARDFVSALTNRNADAFRENLWRYLATFALAVPVGVFYRFTSDRLSLRWREWMTADLLRRYFYNRVYYRLRSSPTVDNPDQRITEDVKLFTSSILGYLLVLINSVVTLIAFLGVLWGISPQLVVALVVYAVGGTGFSILIGRRLIGFHFRQYQAEADLRYGLVRVRDNAESIAFFRGEGREHRDLRTRFGAVIENAGRIIGWNRNLAFFTTSYNYLALVVPPLIVGPMFMRGEIEFGVVAQAEGGFAQVLAALSIIVAQFEGLSQCTAGIRRLGELWAHLDDFDAEDARDAQENQIDVTETRHRLKLDDVTVQTPDASRVLTKALSFDLPPGQSLLIMGESGSGKSSLLRTIAGIWQSGTGTIERPTLKRIMFLPQRPYMVLGSLRAQLLYPQAEDAAGIDDEAVRQVFEEVNLTEIFARVDGDLGKEVDWANVLSLGEQQRLSFARLFLKRPVIAFLDEATSALDENNERQLYERLRGVGISYVSVGHRSTLKQFHDVLITLRADGSWEKGSTSDSPVPQLAGATSGAAVSARGAI